MRNTRGEPCGLCGGSATTYRTDTIKVNEVFKNTPIVRHKYQRRRCSLCGAEGCTSVFVGATEWEESCAVIQPCTPSQAKP